MKRTPIIRRFWGVVTPQNNVWPGTVSHSRFRAIKRFESDSRNFTWRQAYRDGFRLIRLSVTPLIDTPKCDWCGKAPRLKKSPWCERCSKPIFIPLKREYFEAFERGEKTTEYRKRGPLWDATRCRPGRSVTLSLGYTKRRLFGVITAFSYDTCPAKLPGWLECYGSGAGDAACITIKLLPQS